MLAMAGGASIFAMSTSDFKDAAQNMANGMAAGADITLEELFVEVPGSPIANMLGSLPGPFKKLFSKLKFTKGTVRFDEANEVVVIDGSYTIPKANLEGRAVIRFGKDLTEHAQATKKLEANKKIDPKDAQATFAKGLNAVTKHLHASVVLDIPTHFNLGKFADMLSKIPEIGGLFKAEEKPLSALDGLFKGGVAFGFASQSYFDPGFGLLNDNGLNIIGMVDPDAKLKGLAGKILSKLKGLSNFVSLQKGLWVQVVIPASINGLEGEIYIPGNLSFCANVLTKGLAAKCAPEKALLRTKRFRLGLKLNQEGEEYALDGFLAGEALLRLPWQKDPMEVDLQFDLEAGTGEGGSVDVDMTGEIKDLRMGPLPIVLEKVMLTAAIDLNALIDLIKDGLQVAVDVIEDIAKKVVTAVGTTGAEAPVVAVEGAENVAQAAVGAALIETVVGAAAVEGEDLVNVAVEAGGDLAVEGATQAAEEVEQLGEEAVQTAVEAPQEVKDYVFPIRELGLETKINLLGREFDGEFCVNFDEDSFNLILRVALSKGTAKDAITLKDLFDLAVEIQEKELQLAQKLTGFAGLSKFEDGIKKVLANKGLIVPTLDKIFANFALDKADLFIVPQAGKCGEQQFDFSTIEVSLGGKFFKIPFDGDLTITWSMAIAPGEEEGGAEVVKGGEGIGKAAGSLLGEIADIGVYFNGQLGETNLGPITISSEGAGKKTGKPGPRLEFSLGFPKPEAEGESTKVVFDSIVDGQVALNIPPGIKAGLKAHLSPDGITLAVDEKTGDSEIKINGELKLDDLKATKLQIEFVDMQEFAKQINEELKNVVDATLDALPKVAADVEEKLDAVKGAIGKIQGQLLDSKKLLDEYDQAINDCKQNQLVKELGGPVAVPLLDLLNKVTDGLRKLNPDMVTSLVAQYASNYGLDASQVQSVLAGQVKSSAGPRSLQNIPGLLGKL